ncbi:MAG: helix-turn-helix transcriptional regulator [Pikeienuella sp.]
MTEQKFMTVSEVAAHLGINENAVWLLAKTGALPKPVDLGKDLRWLKTEVEAGVAQ